MELFGADPATDSGRWLNSGARCRDGAFDRHEAEGGVVIDDGDVRILHGMNDSIAGYWCPECGRTFSERMFLHGAHDPDDPDRGCHGVPRRLQQMSLFAPPVTLEEPA
jgi:hypothetical protein